MTGGDAVLAVIEPMVEGVRAANAALGQALPIGAALVAMVVGVPVFARGVQRYRRA